MNEWSLQLFPSYCIFKHDLLECCNYRHVSILIMRQSFIGDQAMKKILIYWTLPFSWIGVIFFFSSQSASDQDVKPLLGNIPFVEKLEPLLSKLQFTYYGVERSVEAMGFERFVEFLIRKLAHFGTYFILALLVFIAVQKTLNASLHIKMLFSFYVVILMAVMDEWNQAFTPERTPYYFDVVIDGFGGLMGLLFSVLILLFINRRENKIGG